MTRKLKFAWIGDQRARKAVYKKRMQGLVKKTEELTILCNMSACLIFFSRDDDKLVAWPSHEVAKFLIDRFFSLPDIERNIKADNQEMYIKTNTKKIEKKLANSRKVCAEFEIDHLMFQLQNGGRLVDLRQSQIEKLISYSSKKFVGLGKELGYTGHPYTSKDTLDKDHEPFQGDETPIAPDVASDLGGSCFIPMASGSIYIMDQWFFEDPKAQKHCDETHLPTMVSRVNLNLEPFDDYGDKKIYKGECSKSGGADDA